MLKHIPYWILIYIIMKKLVLSVDANLMTIGGRTFSGRFSGQCDFPGNDLYNYETTLFACELDCELTSSCTHYVFKNINGGRCYLKKGPVQTENIIWVNTTGARCGINTNSSAYERRPREGYGISTAQYWNCKRPACSHHGEVLRSKSYVKGCCKNGESFFDHEKRRYQCKNNTEMFICDDYQPWSVNDKLAYGFAYFMKYYKVFPHSVCCACYALRFINESLQEKTMIIQVIDRKEVLGVSSSWIHGDGLYAELHHLFNLLIPGGRWPYTERCEQKYDGTGYDGSKIFRGALSRDDCFKFPKSIQQGCLFRFDWLKNIGFPRANYTEVKCPKALTDISGCTEGELED